MTHCSVNRRWLSSMNNWWIFGRVSIVVVIMFSFLFFSAVTSSTVHRLLRWPLLAVSVMHRSGVRLSARLSISSFSNCNRAHGACSTWLTRGSTLHGQRTLPSGVCRGRTYLFGDDMTVIEMNRLICRLSQLIFFFRRCIIVFPAVAIKLLLLLLLLLVLLLVLLWLSKPAKQVWYWASPVY